MLLFDFCLNFILKKSFLLSGLKQNSHSHLMFWVPFPVQKSQSQWIKSHFPTHILGQSQSHFAPSGPSFLYDKTTIVLRARLARKVRRTHEQNGAWTVPLWFLGSRLVCSSKIIATFLAIWRLPSSKVRMSALRTWTKTSFRALRRQHVDTRAWHTKTDRVAATNGTKWRTRKYKTEMTTFGTSAMEQIR